MSKSTQNLDAERMSGTPHVVKLVPRSRSDPYERSRLAVVWVSQLFRGDAFGASHGGLPGVDGEPPDDEATEFVPYTTDAVAEVIYYDANGNEQLDVAESTEPRVTARFTRGSNIDLRRTTRRARRRTAALNPAWRRVTWSSYSTSTGAPPRSPGLLRLGDTPYFGAKGYHKWKSDTTRTPTYNNYNLNTGQLYTVKKIYRHKATATSEKLEDRFRIAMDKNLNWGARRRAGHARVSRSSCRTTRFD